MNEVYKKIYELIMSRPLQELGLKKELKVRNMFISFAEIHYLCKDNSKYELQNILKRLHILGKIEYRFDRKNHQKYKLCGTNPKS